MILINNSNYFCGLLFQKYGIRSFNIFINYKDNELIIYFINISEDFKSSLFKAINEK